MDAEHLGFPSDYFDQVTCAFSLFQFIDMATALSQMRRVLKPGGKLGLSNWGPGFFTPVAEMQRDLFRRFGIRPLLTNHLTFTVESMQALLEAVGFSDIQILSEHVLLWFESPEGIWEWNLAMGPFTVMLEAQLSPTERRELKRQYIEMLEPLRTSEGIACTFHPLYALASK
jgi:SAM-dependent methyltransferase